MEYLKHIIFLLSAIFAGVYLISLVRATRRNHEIIKALSDHERQELKQTLSRTLTPPPEIAGAFTAIPKWALVIIFLVFAAAIWLAISYISGN